MGDAILVGHRGDLAGEAVTEGVRAGALAALFSFGPRGQKGVVSIRFELFVGNHLLDT